MMPIMEVATRAIPQAVLYGSLLLVYHTVNLYPSLTVWARAGLVPEALSTL